MRKIFLFDLYDTVLKDISFQFERGMRFLYNRYFSSVCSWEQFYEYENTFFPLYEQRKIEHTEVSLIRDEVIPIFEKFGAVLPEDLDELDFQIMDHMQEEALLPSVRETLAELRKREIPMYILSNAIFSGMSAERLLARFDIGHYFNKVYSSADYGIRKPNRKFFDLAVGEILAAHPGSKREEIIYVGNNYDADVAGGTLAELQTVWYNVDGKPDKDGFGVRSVSDFRELLEELR